MYNMTWVYNYTKGHFKIVLLTKYAYGVGIVPPILYFVTKNKEF